VSICENARKLDGSRTVDSDSTTDRCDSRMDSFWAKARQRDVFPVPGGPCRRTTRFQEMRLTGNDSGHRRTKTIRNCRSQSTFASLKTRVACM